MIKKLIIDNIALIDHLEIDFFEGLTVLSGETGSGKSIIIDSLAFVLGERADKSLIKYGSQCAEVLAIFEVEKESAVVEKMQEYGLDCDDLEILVSRKMTLAGKNEVRIQGKPSTLSILKDICKDLVDIFGQGEHLALLNEKNQLAVVDSFCDFEGVDLKLTEQLYPQLLQVNKQLKSFGGSDGERERLLDILKYQIDEIENANLDEQEEEHLLALHKKMVNIEKITTALSQVNELLSGENGCAYALSQGKNVLDSIANLELQAEQLACRLSSASIEVDDISCEIATLLSQSEFIPSEVDKMEERLETIKQIKRKYGGTVAQALTFLQEAQRKYDDLANASEKIEQLNVEKSNLLKQMYALSQQKSAIRQNTAKLLANNVAKELCDLGMKGTQFVVNFAEQPSFEQYCANPCADGLDKVEFVMSANVGEPLKPLSKVISGGEMSRFMLAVKNVTAFAEKIPTMVFDEIDSGISGNIAQMVACKLAKIAVNKRQGYQCVVITHLPQIVAMADDNLYINKYVNDGKTFTQVQSLQTEDQKAVEVARLMGGVGEHGLQSAQELLLWSRNFKKSI